jgi:hypothetical protein
MPFTDVMDALEFSSLDSRLSEKALSIAEAARP